MDEAAQWSRMHALRSEWGTAKQCAGRRHNEDGFKTPSPKMEINRATQPLGSQKLAHDFSHLSESFGAKSASGGIGIWMQKEAPGCFSFVAN